MTSARERPVVPGGMRHHLGSGQRLNRRRHAFGRTATGAATAVASRTSTGAGNAAVPGARSSASIIASAESKRSAGSGASARATASATGQRDVRAHGVDTRDGLPIAIGGGEQALVGERRGAGEHLVEDHPDGVDVGGRRHRFAARLLGGEVPQGADDESGRGEAVGEVVEPLGDAEVGELGITAPRRGGCWPA